MECYFTAVMQVIQPASVSSWSAGVNLPPPSPVSSSAPRRYTRHRGSPLLRAGHVGIRAGKAGCPRVMEHAHRPASGQARAGRRRGRPPAVHGGGPRQCSRRRDPPHASRRCAEAGPGAHGRGRIAFRLHRWRSEAPGAHGRGHAFVPARRASAGEPPCAWSQATAAAAPRRRQARETPCAHGRMRARMGFRTIGPEGSGRRRSPAGTDAG